MTGTTLPEHSPAQSPDSVEPSVLYEHGDGVALITLNRPRRMNALNVGLLLELARLLEHCQDNPDISVILLTGAQGHFSTGADLKDTSPGPNGEERLDVLHRCFLLLMQSRKPVIAAVAGNAYGAGLSLALACDYIVAARSARFCAPFTGVGLVPDTGLAYTLPLRIGMGRARRMMFEGLVVEAELALDWGLVESVVDDPVLLEHARAIAARLMTRAPLALQGLRSLLARQWPDPVEFLREEQRLQKQLLTTRDVQEARRAFAEKRSPRFEGR